MTINLEHPKLTGETTVQGAVTEVAAMVGENVKFRRGFILSTSSHGVVSTYLHTCPQPGKENYLEGVYCKICCFGLYHPSWLIFFFF